MVVWANIRCATGEIDTTIFGIKEMFHPHCEQSPVLVMCSSFALQFSIFQWIKCSQYWADSSEIRHTFDTFTIWNNFCAAFKWKVYHSRFNWAGSPFLLFCLVVSLSILYFFGSIWFAYVMKLLTTIRSDAMSTFSSSEIAKVLQFNILDKTLCIGHTTHVSENRLWCCSFRKPWLIDCLHFPSAQAMAARVCVWYERNKYIVRFITCNIRNMMNSSILFAFIILSLQSSIKCSRLKNTVLGAYGNRSIKFRIHLHSNTYQ